MRAEKWGFYFGSFRRGRISRSRIADRCQQLEAAATRLRVNDKNKTWRLFYFLDSDAIVILEVWEKKTRKTSQATIELCQRQAKEL